MKNILLIFLVTFISITSEAQKIKGILYKKDQWIDVEGKGGFIKAGDNPTDQKAEIFKTNKNFKVTLGDKTLNYLIISSNSFSNVRTDYKVILNGKSYLLSIAEIPDGTYVIGIEKKWYVVNVSNITTVYEEALNKNEKISLPFIINQSFYNNLLTDNPRYSRINDTAIINRLLSLSLKKKLIDLNNNPNLTDDYTFFYIGNSIFKKYQLEIFVHQYHGLGDQLNAHLNIRNSNGEIIDTKEIGCYIESEMQYLLTTCTIDDKGIISMKISKEKSSRNERYQINPVGKIIKMQVINNGK